MLASKAFFGNLALPCGSLVDWTMTFDGKFFSFLQLCMQALFSYHL